jgi:hypothetical protein
MYDRPACLPGAVRVPDTQHLLPGGEGNIPWEWTGAGEQTIRCERKGCCGKWARTIDPVTLSAGVASYVGADGVGATVPPPCPDREIPF